MYLNGNGIHRRTRELTNAVWDKLPHAIFGITLATAGPIVTCVLILHRFSWDLPVGGEQKLLALLISGTCIGVGICIARPWFQAKRALDEHAARLRRETELRGKGWARS